MIRLTALWLVVFGVFVLTWKDWFKGLCALVVLIGIVEYPDVPKSMFGIAGLNFFNLLLLNVVLAWIVRRSQERLTWDMPEHHGLRAVKPALDADLPQIIRGLENIRVMRRAARKHVAQNEIGIEFVRQHHQV